MKTSNYTQCILCEGATFEESVRKFNVEMRRNAHLKPTYERVGESFLIFVTLYDTIPETIAEAKELEGCKHYCSQCDHCIRPLNRSGKPDMRNKRATCDVTGKHIRIDMLVCDTFYLENQDRKEEQDEKSADTRRVG